MENEIKVGEFIRTKDGLIRKVKKIDILIYIDEVYISNEPEYHNSLIEEDIVKHSSNLIDLIQCGDYVNGHLVIDILGDGSGAVYLEQITKGALIPTLKEDIQTIVTKEMMESISYKVTKM